MFDVGFWELAIIAVIALLVIGPERLPKAARTAGLWVGRARRMVREVKADIDKEIRESDLSELKKAGEELKKSQSTIESAGSELIEDTAIGELKKTEEEFKVVKSEIESVGANLSDSNSIDSTVKTNTEVESTATETSGKNPTR